MRAADDFNVIRARMVELQRERAVPRQDDDPIAVCAAWMSTNASAA